MAIPLLGLEHMCKNAHHCVGVDIFVGSDVRGFNFFVKRSETIAPDEPGR